MKTLITCCILFSVLFVPSNSLFSIHPIQQDHFDSHLKEIEELPVTLLAFRGKLVIGEHIRLNWAVRDEIDVDYYEVQKIVQGFWVPIGRVQAAGQDEYNYKDFDFTRTNMYRLKIVDLDESFVYSDIVRIKSKRFDFSLNVFPNPFSESFKIINTNQDYSYRILDSMGNLIVEGISNELEDASHRLDKGIYFLHVIDNKTKIRETIRIKKN